MKQFIQPLCAAIVACAFLAGCSTASLDKFTGFLDRFDAGVERVDASIAKTSTALAKYCGDAQDVGEALEPLLAKNEKARAGLAAVNAGIRSWCQQPPQNITTAVSSMAKVVADGKAAYKAAKSGG